MISFQSFTLANGLEVHVHEDKSVPVAVLNLLYKAGSRNEHPEKTGFAHLFEHLMFGGSQNIPSYDEPLQRVGGENNAFTNTDITNYYLSVPAANIETGFWLESDRMLGLSFDPRVLDVQRKVVVEEFKQRYLNHPYGDVWLKLRPLAYQTHPYRWATIGKEPAHIEQATLEDVKDFFYRYYRPNNAVMVVAGNVSAAEVQRLSEKWFGPIPAGAPVTAHWQAEPPQTAKRTAHTHAAVPADALYKAWHMPGRFHADYPAFDLLSDLLGRGQSSRLHQTLVKEKQVFSSISCFVTGTLDPGLLVVSGHVAPGVSLDQAEEEVDAVLARLADDGVPAAELEKVKNQAEAAMQFGEVDMLNRAMNLAFSSLSGDAGWLNRELHRVRGVTPEDILRAMRQAVREENSSVLYYHSEKRKSA
jgi:zinc protease